MKIFIFTGILVLSVGWLLTSKELFLTALSDVEVNSGPNSREVVAILKKGAEVVVINCEDEKGITAARVNVDGKDGYIIRGDFDVVERQLWNSDTFHPSYGCRWFPRHLRE